MEGVPASRTALGGSPQPLVTLTAEYQGSIVTDIAVDALAEPEFKLRIIGLCIFDQFARNVDGPASWTTANGRTDLELRDVGPAQRKEGRNGHQQAVPAAQGKGLEVLAAGALAAARQRRAKVALDYPRTTIF
jgi:hypothetical protein